MEAPALKMGRIIEEYAQMGVTIQTFQDDAEAMKWLASLDRVTRNT